jgi:hypothetical protein
MLIRGEARPDFSKTRLIGKEQSARRFVHSMAFALRISAANFARALLSVFKVSIICSMIAL